jgi:PAS domain S-box-containing protein
LFAQRKDGSEFPIEAGLSTIQTQDGRFVITFLSDITERKQAEAEIQRLNASLERRARESETRYQQIVELAEEGIWVIDNCARTTYVNRAIARMLGYTESELLGRPIADFRSDSPELQASASVVNPGNSSEVSRGELKLKTKAGEDRWVYMSTSPALDETGKMLWACALVYDITERKQAEAQLRESNERISLANAELARATRLKDEFLASMSHELRTPLNSILGLSEALQEEVYGELTQRQRKSLATIEQSGKHLLELINDILDLSKIESGKMALQISPVSLENLCQSSLTFIKQQAHQKQIALECHITPGLEEIAADERRLRQVLVNLLSNAVKFTPEGGRVVLAVSANPENKTVQFSVRDTGIGIAPENLDKLFQPFVQLDSRLSRRYAGTGLGLCLVRRIVELHGGGVTLESEVDRGSCFTVTLPWQPSGRELRQLQESRGELQSLPPIDRALIIEDSEPAAKQIARYFRELGAIVTIQPHGEGVVDVALQCQPDIIVLDVLLPHLSGWEVLAQLKGNPATQPIPVLVISVVDERSQSVALGAADYLLKPISRQQFRAALQNVFATGLTPSPPPPSETGSPLILLAEDNEANIVTVGDYLQIQGYRLIVARNGTEAVQMAIEQEPDLILMDIQMPEMDGLEATRRIRAEAKLATLPIIALTALAMPGDRDRCLAVGANEYLTKPVSLKELSRQIARYVHRTNV